MITYKPHPWVSSVKFKMIDENHIRVLIKLSEEGEDAELLPCYGEFQNSRFVLSKVYSNGWGGIYHIDSNQYFCLTLPGSDWKLVVSSTKVGENLITFVKSSVEDKEDYWTEAEIE